MKEPLPADFFPLLTSKQLLSGFRTALKFGFLTDRLVLNVLEKRKKYKFTAEVKPHSAPFSWTCKKKIKNDFSMRTPCSLVPLKKLLKILFCLFLGAFSNHAQEIISLMEISKEGITTKGMRLNGDRENFGTDCPPVNIAGKMAFSADCLKHLSGIHLDYNPQTDKTIAMNLEVFLPENFTDREYPLFYDSSFPVKYGTLKILSTIGLPKGTWTTWTFMLSGLKTEPDMKSHIFFDSERMEEDYTSHIVSITRKRTDDAILCETDRVKLLEKNSSAVKQNHKNVKLFQNPGFHISAIYFQTLQAVDEQKLITAKSKTNYPDIIKILLSLMIAGLCIGFRYRIAFKTLFALLIMLLPLLFFLSRYFINLFDEISITTMQQEAAELRRDFLELRSLYESAEAKLTEKVLELLPELQKQIASLKMDNSELEQEVELNIHYRNLAESTLTHENPKQEMTKILTEVYQKFWPVWENHHRNDEKLLAELKNDFSRLNEDEYISHADANQLYNGIKDLLTTRFSLYLMDISRRTGLMFYLTNNHIYFDLIRSGRGSRTRSFWDQALNHALRIEMETAVTEQADVVTSRQAGIGNIREQMDKSGFSTDFIEDFLNQPWCWHTPFKRHGDNQLESTMWFTIPDEKTGEWLVNVNFREEIALTELQKLLAEKKDYLQKKGLSFFISGLDYNADRPYKAQNNPLYTYPAARASEKNTIVNGIFQHENKSVLFVSSPFPKISHYSFTLIKNLSSVYRKIRYKKNMYLIAMGLLLLLLSTISWLISAWICKPYRKMQQALSTVSNNLQSRLDERSEDEFGRLSAEFNKMLDSLSEKQKLMEFLSKDALEGIFSHSESIREPAAIIFCGLIERDENSLALLSSRERFAIINDFVSLVQDCINNKGGMIDKFTGTACLGVFRHNSVASALEAAAEIREKLSEMNQKNRNLVPAGLKTGIGIASGQLVLGHVGSEGRKDFTAIGNTVNMAARLETLSAKRPENCIIYLDEATKNQAPEKWQIVYHGPMPIKGKQEEQHVHELL
jgi:class 3 adenylate cyclase